MTDLTVPEHDDNDEDYFYFRLLCPACHTPDIIADKADVDEYGEFVGDPVITCLKCGHVCRVSGLERQEWTGGMVH